MDALPAKICATRSAQRAARSPAGQNRALICAVSLTSATRPLPALTFSEIIATSDLPAGVVNILSGNAMELAPHIASHMDINAIVDGSGDSKLGEILQQGGGLNVKRYARREL